MGLIPHSRKQIIGILHNEMIHLHFRGDSWKPQHNKIAFLSLNIRQEYSKQDYNGICLFLAKSTVFTRV